MNEELDYAQMLEIPVNTVNVVKKKSIFRRKEKAQPQEDLKAQVVESVNERVGAFVAAKDLSDPPKPEKVKAKAIGKSPLVQTSAPHNVSRNPKNQRYVHPVLSQR